MTTTVLLYVFNTTTSDSRLDGYVHDIVQ